MSSYRLKVLAWISSGAIVTGLLIGCSPAPTQNDVATDAEESTSVTVTPVTTSEPEKPQPVESSPAPVVKGSKPASIAPQQEVSPTQPPGAAAPEVAGEDPEAVKRSQQIFALYHKIQNYDKLKEKPEGGI
ncbi:MAG: hypothetical protein RBU21_19010, partial [FCB group bacterium]|nr:hypothetical protein [FCB group bacterium]